LAIQLIKSGNLLNISGENLPRMEDIFKLGICLFCDLKVNFMNIAFRSPRVSIHYCEINIVGVDSSLLEVSVLQLFNTP
jgi:hypothetical protein